MSIGQRPLRLGLIGVDSPHAPQFTRAFGDGVTGAVRGARITHAWREEVAPDFTLSQERIDGFATELTQLGMVFCSRPQEVAEKVDALLVVSSDARTHPDLFTQLAPAGKPIYVDTRFALTVAEATRMLSLAREHGCVPLAGSPKRFTPEFLGAMDNRPVIGAELHGALTTRPGHPTLSWYGWHLADLAVRAMGARVAAVDAPPGEAVRVSWADGRQVTLHGGTEWTAVTSGRLQLRDAGTTEFHITAGPPMLHGLLRSIVDACRVNRPNVPLPQVLATVGIVEAAHRSRLLGRPVGVDELAVGR